MERTLAVPDSLASDVNRFAASHDLSVDRAYELLLSVGLETLDGLDLNVSVEEGHLVLECPACADVFASTSEAVTHGCVEE